MYQSKTFDYGATMGAFRRVVNQITGLPVVPINKDKLPDYPYITYENDNSGTPETWANSREFELFTMPVTLVCYSDNKPQEVLQIASDIDVLLRDQFYKEELNHAGIIIKSSKLGSLSSSEFTSIFGIYSQPVEVVLRLVRDYRSKYPNITSTDLTAPK